MKTPPSKRLVIDVYPPVSEWPELAELEARGHTVRRMNWTNDTEADLILGPRCWRMSEHLRKYLKDAVKAAIAQRVGK